jgi:hypothetical protein
MAIPHSWLRGCPLDSPFEKWGEGDFANIRVWDFGCVSDFVFRISSVIM